VRIRRKVNINGMQLLFSPGKGTADAISKMEERY